MKKILFLLALLIFPLVVFADGAGPYVREYEAYVKNPAGAILYTYEGRATKVVVPVDYEFTVSMEEIIDGIYFVDVRYKDDYYLCKASDLALKKDSVIPNDKDFWKSETPVKLYTFKKGGYLYKGPSKKYDKVTDYDIPVGTIITYEYNDYGWAYVTYNNNSGWIFIYNENDRNNPYDEGTCFATLSDKTLITVPGSKLKDENGNVLAEINDFTEVRVNYYTGYFDTYSGGANYNIDYEGKNGWVDVKAVSNESNDTIFILNNINMTDFNGNKIVNIPKNKEFDFKYLLYNFEDSPSYYIEYNGKKGFVQGYDDILSSWDSSDNYYISTDFELYDNPNGRVKDKKSSGEVFKIKYEKYGEETAPTWIYVYNDDYTGWIKINNLEVLNLYNNGVIDDIADDYWEVPTYDDDYWNEYNNDYDDDNSSLLDDENPIIHTGLNPIDLTIYCIIGSGILAITSFVTIKLINKKKKVKNELLTPNTESEKIDNNPKKKDSE